MSIGSVGYAGYTEYTSKYIADQTDKTSAKTGFSKSVEKAETAGKTGGVKESAVERYIKKHPEDRSHVEGQVRAGKKVLEKNGVQDVSRDDMTMEEYKRFFTALMDSIPFDASHQGDVEIWSISEKGWEQMKNDPEYEAWVLGYTSENRSVYNPFASWPGYSPNVCTENFGDSIEQHIGQSVPMSSGSSKKTDSDEESWWEKRQKRLKELIELQEKAARERAAAYRKSEQAEMLQEQMMSNARLRNFLTDGISGEENTVFSSGHVTVATNTYLNMMDLFSGNIGNNGMPENRREIEGYGRISENFASPDRKTEEEPAEKLTVSYNGVPLRRSADDKKYTDKETGISYYVADGKHPYITGEDVEKLKELCAATGEPLLKKMGEITGMIRHLDENTTAYVGDNGTVIKSKDGRELSINTSLLSYDVLSFMFRNIGSSGDYFSEKYWSGKIQDAVGNYLTGGK